MSYAFFFDRALPDFVLANIRAEQWFGHNEVITADLHKLQCGLNGGEGLFFTRFPSDESLDFRIVDAHEDLQLGRVTEGHWLFDAIENGLRFASIFGCLQMVERSQGAFPPLCLRVSAYSSTSLIVAEIGMRFSEDTAIEFVVIVMDNSGNHGVR